MEARYGRKRVPSRRCVLQGKGVSLTSTLLLMVISHKFNNNLILLVHPELLSTTLLSSKPRCQSGPGVQL
eukprot:1967407-Prymnesium_polylepis.1